MTNEMKIKLKQYKYIGRVEFFNGNGLETEDLYRISLRSASASFLLANVHASNSKIEDEINMLRALSMHQYAPSLPIFLETIRPEGTYIKHDFTTGSNSLVM
jgi:hypothetical protein